MPDVTHLIVAKSDQLNADDLIAGPVVIQIKAVEIRGGEQPMSIISADHKPWKPCKTTIRIMAALWGNDSDGWVGKWVRLFRDPEVTFGDKETRKLQQVGGIRISGMSDIDQTKVIVLAKSRGVKTKHEIAPIRPPSETPDAKVKAGLLHAVRLKLSALGLGDQDLIDYIASVVAPGQAIATVEEWAPERLAWVDRQLANGWRTELPAWLAAREVDDGGVMP